ncbi:MAG TPA: hypothetical protein PLU50_01525 [Pseudobdellovibrionaceae bacterium]|nr:hypothetical protein [Pseudobdellovibrionaceae bacterium]
MNHLRISLQQFLQVISGLVLLTTLGCAPGKKTMNVKDDGLEFEARKMYLGNLVEGVDELYKNREFLSQCDVQWEGRVKELVKLLDSRQLDIKKGYVSIKNKANEKRNKDLKSYRYGELVLIDNGEESVSEERWVVTDNGGWREMWERYESNPDDIENLAGVDFRVRSLIPDYTSRMILHKHPSVLPKNQSMFESIYSNLHKCYQDSRCKLPALTGEQIQFLNLEPKMKYLWEQVSTSNNSLKSSRDSLEVLEDMILGHVQRYAFYKNEKARMDGNTLTVPFNLAALNEGAQDFAAFLSKSWSLGSFDLKIIPVESGTDIFQFVFKKDFAARAFVDPTKKTYNISQQDTVKTAIHEMGHILGFRDYYYTAWEEESCKFFDLANQGDVMSNHPSGSVLPRHWEMLRSVYGSSK